jgi:hypothetical protein
MSLASLALNKLGIGDKFDYIDALKKKFKIRNTTDLLSAPGLVDDEIFKKYALNDVILTAKLHQYYQAKPNYSL